MSDAATELRAKQKPLKDKYRSDPSSAVVTLKSTGSLDAGLTCSLATGAAAKKVAGLHKAAGGAGFDASGELCSGDMLLESLVACFGVTVRAVATAMSVPIDGGSVVVEGDLDFRGTLGIKNEDGEAVPVGFKTIRLITDIKVAEEHQASLDKVLSLSQRYCVVLQTIAQGVDVIVTSGGQSVAGHAKESVTSKMNPDEAVSDKNVMPVQAGVQSSDSKGNRQESVTGNVKPEEAIKDSDVVPVQ